MLSRKIFAVTWLLLAATAAQVVAQEIDYKGFPQWSWHQQDSTQYYLYTPSNMEPGKRYPVALFLHGCCGKTYQATLRNAVDPPARMWHGFGANVQLEPTYIVSPATSRGWNQHFENLKAVIDDLVKNQQADPRRIYITGFSMGSAGTIAFLEKYPDYFAAALPMGMDIRGDISRIKDVPIWTNKGETDWHARNLNKAVADIRALHGDNIDSSANHVTGVNPRFTEFKGVGHNVQWIAASTQDLTAWAYTKVNDGNKYPAVFFKAPKHRAVVKERSAVPLEIEANDPDGRIERVEIHLNGKLFTTLKSKPYTTTVRAEKGDTRIEAVAFDEKGKSSTATTVFMVDIPAKLTTAKLPPAHQGKFYQHQLLAGGNGRIQFNKADGLPPGMALRADGTLRGIPEKPGTYAISLEVKDEDGDAAKATLVLTVEKKDGATVIVTNARDRAGRTLPLTTVAIGEAAHAGRADDEVTISNAAGYGGLTLIQTAVKDTLDGQPYMTFDVDEDVTVFVAYETKDRLFKSGVPAWLGDFRKEDKGQIVTQYFYYNVYAKDFPKGTVSLPDAAEAKNGVSTNYFVMVKKR